MPDYQWAVGKGKIITADYDRSMALNADQVEGEVRKAFSNLFDGVVVEPISKEFKEVYKVTSDWKTGNQKYENVVGLLLDVKYLMGIDSRLDESEIMKLAAIIEEKCPV